MATVPTVDLTSDDPAEEAAEADGRTDVAQLEHQLRLVDEELVDVCQLLQLLQRDITSSMYNKQLTLTYVLVGKLATTLHRWSVP
jgi:hypothetical protein